LRDWLQLMSERPMIQQVDGEHNAAVKEFLENAE